jgi:hypothetical protein
MGVFQAPVQLDFSVHLGSSSRSSKKRRRRRRRRRRQECEQREGVESAGGGGGRKTAGRVALQTGIAWDWTAVRRAADGYG